MTDKIRIRIRFECPECGAMTRSKNIDTRYSLKKEAVRRRRECLECGARFTTYELMETDEYLAIIGDLRKLREKFIATKIQLGTAITLVNGVIQMYGKD